MILAINFGFYLPQSLKNYINSKREFLAVGNEEMGVTVFSCELGINRRQGEDCEGDRESRFLGDGNERIIYSSGEEREREGEDVSIDWKGKRRLNLCADNVELTFKFSLGFPSIRLAPFLSVGLLNDENDVQSDVSEETRISNKPSIEESRIEADLVRIVREILLQNNPRSVELCEAGVGGTYFLRGENGEKIAVFKPLDEEPGAEGNPKERQSNPLLPPGGGFLREVAAYLLDHDGFAGVPETHFVSDLRHSSFSPNGKQGSLQRFVENTEDPDISPSRFSVPDVHKIGIFDIRLFNMDRNMENMLIESHKNPRLIPIDHTYTLPPRLDYVWFEWQYWKQAKQPFSDEHLSYIRSLDVHRDASILQNLGLDASSIRTMMISTTLLKISALQYGLNLFQIASVISRKNPNTPSTLEMMVSRAESLAEDNNTHTHMNTNIVFLDVLTRVIKEDLEKIK